MKKADNYLDLARELKKTMEHEDDGATNCSWCAWNDPQILGKGAERFRNRRTSYDHQNCDIVGVGSNTEKIPGDLRRITITQTPVKYNQPALALKTRK